MHTRIEGLFGFIKLTRGWNLLIIFITQMMTAYYLIVQNSEGLFTLDGKFFLLTFSTLTIAAAGYLINDYYDVKIDYINKPERVVVGKTLKRRIVLVIHLLLNLVGLTIGYYIGFNIFLINLASIFLLWIYSNQLKRMALLGNLSIALLTATSVIQVGVYFNYFHYNIILYSLFAFFYTVIREIIKDIEDLKGDSEFGLKTLPILAGIRNTKGFIYILILTFNLVALYLVDISYLFWLIFMVGLTIINFILILIIYRSDRVIDFNRISTFCKFLMVLGILSMVFVV